MRTSWLPNPRPENHRRLVNLARRCVIGGTAASGGGGDHVPTPRRPWYRQRVLAAGAAAERATSDETVAMRRPRLHFGVAPGAVLLMLSPATEGNDRDRRASAERDSVAAERSGPGEQCPGLRHEEGVAIAAAVARITTMPIDSCAIDSRPRSPLRRRYAAAQVVTVNVRSYYRERDGCDEAGGDVVHVVRRGGPWRALRTGEKWSVEGFGLPVGL